MIILLRIVYVIACLFLGYKIIKASSEGLSFFSGVLYLLIFIITSGLLYQIVFGIYYTFVY